MAFTARCKFRIEKIEVPSEELSIISLHTMYDDELHKAPEDKYFSKATPSGNMRFSCTNPVVKEALKEGDYYYVDLIKVDNEQHTS